MKHNDFYTRIDTMLADPDFQSKFDTQDDMLDDLRDDIEDAETPPWIIAAIVEMNEGFSEGINRRYRSSTNNEDLPGFNGAGLYDSKSQKPSEDEDDLAKSLKEVYASLWNFRAFIERDFHRIDHKAAAMGVLVHPSYQDELANGVAVSFDPIYGSDKYYYVNTQLGEDLVTNPDAQSVPEEIRLYRTGSYYYVLATSNQVPPGQLLMSNAQLNQLGDHLTVIHERFAVLYNPEPDEPFAMEIEFKITSENILAIKQARPWVFDNARDAPSPPPPPPANTPATGAPTITGTARVDETLTAATTGISDADGLTSPSYTYQWIRVISSVDADIAGATSSTYTLVDADLGKTIKVKVTFTDDASNAETRTSVATGTVAAAANTPATGAPTITGTAQVGETLTAVTSGIMDADGLASPSYAYQWIRVISSVDADIAGATSSTYTLVAANEGTTIKVKVTFDDDAGNPETLTSAATAVVVAKNTPDTTAPTVSRVEITSLPGPDVTYAAGEVIELTVTFSETVVVTGTPQLRLRVGSRTRTAGYLRGTDTAVLVFGYEVAEGDEDTDGVSMEANSLTRNVGTIRDGADNNALLSHDGLAADARHKVDGVRPSFLSAVVDGASLTLTYDEPLDGSSTPDAGDFTVSGGDYTRTVTRVSVSGSTVALTLECGGRALGDGDPGELHAGDGAETAAGRAGQ